LKLYLREAIRVERAEASQRMALTNLAVWGEPADIKQKMEELTESD
jgi:hypothetical protein